MANTSGGPDSGFAGNAWPVFRSLQSWRLQFLTHDLFAGLTLAAIAIPEQMATARLGGFAPQIGFFAFLAGSLHSPCSAATASCRAARIRPSRPFSPAGSRRSPSPADPQYQVLAAALALMVGSGFWRRAFSGSAGSPICSRSR